MKRQGWKSRLNRFSVWVMNLAYINLLWMAFTVLGLVVFGFIPSTVAMFAVLRKWMMGKLDHSIFKTFWSYYRKEFLKANAAGLPIVLIGYILFVDLTVVEFGQSLFEQIHHLLVIIIAATYLMAIVFFFPLYVHYDLKWFQYIKLTFLTGISAPLRAIWMFFIAFGVFYILFKIPAAILFFSGSLISYLWLMIALPLFLKLEQKGLRQSPDSGQREG